MARTGKRPDDAVNNDRRRLLVGGSGLAALSMALPAPGAAQAQPPRTRAGQRRPNIVFMMVDNYGFGDLGCYGGGELRGVPTPRVDKLASEGIRLTNFNVEPECTPSRSAFLTGRMPIRSGTSMVELNGGKDGLSPWEYTLAEMLSDVGYATACYGKWHLGSSQGRFPTDQGFDEWFGIPRSSGEVNWPIQPGFDPAEYQNQPILEGKFFFWGIEDSTDVRWGQLSTRIWTTEMGKVKENGKMVEKEVEKVLGKTEGEAQPHIIIQTPHRYIDEFPSFVSIGYVWLSRPLPYEAKYIDIEYTYTTKTAGGGEVASALKWEKMLIPATWKLKEGQTWDADVVEATEEEIAGKNPDEEKKDEEKEKAQ